MKKKVVCEGIIQIDVEDGPQTIQHDKKDFHRIMNFFYIDVPADELDLPQVSALCHARAEEPRCFHGANKIVKTLFKKFLINQRPKHVLEVGAGSNPILNIHDDTNNVIEEYVLSDADNNYQNVNVKFDAKSSLKYSKDYFDIVIALFVLHFKFYDNQISQIYSHLQQDGIFLANVYNRTDESREKLKLAFQATGFIVDLVKDPKAHCKNHYYLLATKNLKSKNLYKKAFLKLISSN